MKKKAARYKPYAIWPGSIFVRLMTTLVIATLLGGCSSQIVSVSKDGSTIANIHVVAAGGNQPEQFYTANVCKGFLLTEQQVRDFFVYANYIDDTSADNRYDILPCYSSGTATINNTQYEWTIRAGGIGEFTSAHNRFVKICGKNCCSKVQGIC